MSGSLVHNSGNSPRPSSRFVTYQCPFLGLCSLACQSCVCLVLYFASSGRAGRACTTELSCYVKYSGCVTLRSRFCGGSGFDDTVGIGFLSVQPGASSSVYMNVLLTLRRIRQLLLAVSLEITTRGVSYFRVYGLRVRGCARQINVACELLKHKASSSTSEVRNQSARKPILIRSSTQQGGILSLLKEAGRKRATTEQKPAKGRKPLNLRHAGMRRLSAAPQADFSSSRP